MSSVEKKLSEIAKHTLTSQQRIRERQSALSKVGDTLSNKSYATEDKKLMDRRFREFENKEWKPKAIAFINNELKKVAPHARPGSAQHKKLFDAYYNKASRELQAAKVTAQQRAGTQRMRGQTQRDVDNKHRLKAAEKSGSLKSTAAAMAARDAVESNFGALGVGATRSLQFAAQLAADVGENDDGGIFDRGAKALESHEKNLTKNTYPSYGEIKENGTFIQNLALSATEMAPMLAANVGITGAAVKGAQLLGAGTKLAAATSYGTTGAIGYSQAYGDGHSSTKQELEEAGALQLANKPRSKELYEGYFNDNIKAGMSEDEAWSKARDQTVSSIAEESGHTVGVATMALSMLAPGVGSFTANRAAGGAVTKWGQKVFNKLAVRADAGKVAKYAVPAAVGAGIVVLNVAEEALQEGTTDYVAQKTAVDVGVKPAINIPQLKEAVLMGGILGGMMGGSVYVGTRNSKLHQAQDDLRTAQQAYAEVAGQIPQLQQQIEAVSPRSPEGQALTARVEETRAALDAMAAEAEKASIPRTSLARRAPRIEPTNSTANDFDGQVEGATELDDQGFENTLNPDGTPAAPAAPIMSEQELDAQDAQIAELIAEQQQLDEAIEDGSNEKPLEESIAAAQSWYDSKRGEGKQGLSGVVSRAAATEQDTAFEQQQEVIKGTTTSINDYIAGERTKQQQTDAQLQQEASTATTDAEKQAVAQKIAQREAERAKEDEVLSTREQLAQPYENELFDTTIMGADGAPFKLARFWDSNLPAGAKAKAITEAFGGQVEQNVAKSDWSTLPEGVQKDLHKWFAERLDGVRQSREAGEQTAEQVADPVVEQQQEVAPTASGLTMPAQQPVAEQAPIAPVAAEPVTEVDSTPAAMQLTDENPVINVPAPSVSTPKSVPVVSETTTETASTIAGIYKSKSAAQAAIKKQKLNPETTATVKADKGWQIIEAQDLSVTTPEVASIPAPIVETDEQSEPAKRAATKKAVKNKAQSEDVTTESVGETKSTVVEVEVDKQPLPEKSKGIAAQQSTAATQSNVEESETVAASPVKPPQSSVLKAETAPEIEKPAAKFEPKTVENPTPAGDWQTQMNGNQFRANKDGITVRKHDRVVHIRGATSITANKKAKELVSHEIRDLHYIAAKENSKDPFSEASIWLDGQGDMIRKKGTKKPKGPLLQVLKQSEGSPKSQPTVKPDKSNGNAGTLDHNDLESKSQVDAVRKQYEGTDKWLKAPNGKKTKLTEQQWLQVRTPAFKEWFGDWEGDPDNASKVVDDNGEPLILHHGTGKNFTEFSKKYFNSTEPRGDYMGQGFYFSPDKEKADRYASAQNSTEPTVISTMLSIKNPIVISGDKSRSDLHDMFGGFKEFYTIMRSDPADVQKKLAEFGYDGLIDKDYDQYATFEPNQIKSATENAGTFDPSNPDIRYSKTNPAKGLTGTTSQQVIEVLQNRFGKETVAKLVKAGKLRVRTLNDFVNSDGRLLIPSDAEGFYHRGKVVLIADNLTTDTAVATLLHELGGHAGIQNMLAPQTYMSLMESFYGLVNSGNKYAVRAKERAEAMTGSDSEARDEYIPYLITEYAQATERGGPLAVIKRFINRVVAGVRAWISANTGVELKLTPNDITQLAERMVKRLAKQSANDMTIAGIDNVAAVQAQFSQVEAPQSEVDAVRKQYEGTDEWMKAPNGLPSKLTELQWLQVRTPSFKNWFGDWENGQRTEESRGDNTRTTTGGGRDNGQLRNRDIGRSLDGPRNNGSGDSRNTGGGRQSESALLRTTDSQRITKLDTKTGEPRVFLHGTQDDFFIFDSTHANKKDFGWLGVGNYFTTNDQVAGLYALNKKGGSGDKNVMNVYLNARNPFVATKSLKNMIRDGGKAEAEEFTQYLIDNGHDSVVLDNGADNLEVMVLDANQVKSATENAGTFDGSNPDIRFSRRYSNADQNEDAATKQQRASSAVRLGAAAASAANAGTVRLMRRHIATPQHVAILNPDFKKAHDNIQARLAYENHEAGKVQVHVPEIWDTRLLVGKRKKDIENVSKALFDGTMADKVWTDDELKTDFKLGDKQIDLYRRTRIAIDDSLGNMTMDIISALAKGTKLININTINRVKLDELPPDQHYQAIKQYMIDELQRVAKGGLITPKAEARMQKQLDDVFEIMEAVTDKYESLLDNGYAPLMRFGNYAVEVRNKETGELDLFELYEGNDTTGPLKQWKAIKELEKKYNLDEYTISKGTLNPDAFKQFTDKGLSPETVQLFAAELGLDEDGAHQAYLKVAISDRSALKRLIHRKKVPGYSEDMPRVLSAFVMSNARHSGRMLYNGEIESSIQKIKDGNLQGEMQNVFKNMEDPQEEYAGIRSALFHWSIAFSPAFLLLNLTQSFTQTIPKLAAYSGVVNSHKDMSQALGIVGKYSGKATWNTTKWVAGKDDPNWQGFEDHLPVWVKKEDYLRMSREGHLDPQNVWMIRGLERGKTGIASGAWGGFENLAGWPAEVSEGINRRSAMIAAFKTAHRMGEVKLKAKGFDSKYEFVVSVIQQTQGVYNKGNRSGLARGTGKLGQFGPLVMVFKQFTINYFEQMIRHSRDKEFKSLALMIMWQFGITGLFGLPFVDDLRDIIEGLWYWAFGKPLNLADELETLMGKTAAQNLMYGIPSNNNPIDFYGRSSMGNLLPLTDFARPNEGDWGEVIGASSSFFENFYTASKYLAEGRYRDAVVVASPRYIKDAVNGYEIYTTGSYRNHKGDKIMDMSKSDGLIKGLGQFNPSSNAKSGRERSESYHMKNMIKHNQDRYALKLAEAIYEENDKLYDEIYEEMDAWNERNKEPYLIDIEKVEKSAENRVEKKDFGSAERSEKALPDQLEEYLEDKAGT